MIRSAIPGLSLLVLLSAAGVAGQDPLPPLPGVTATIFNGSDLKGWKTDRSLARVVGGSLRIEESAGWVRTLQPYADFTLRLDVRMMSDDSQAAVFVRAYPSPETSAAIPRMGYEVIARENPSEVRIAPRQLDARPMDFEHPSLPSKLGSNEFHKYEIDCRGTTLTVKVDGFLVDSLKQLQNPSGYIGLKVRKGKAEFRYIDVEQAAVPGASYGAKVYASDEAGIVAPKVVQKAEAEFPIAARERTIQGLVKVEGIVAADGSVHNIVVVLPLDPQFGVDAAAMAAFSKWRFTPGTKDGQYVPVRVTGDFLFNVKR